MRSSVPIPGNPWPHDMVITVEDHPHALVDLLWIREAWNLQPAGAYLPPLLSDGSVSAHARTELSDRVRAWQDAWPSIWEACVHHAGLLIDGARLFEAAGGSIERAELLKTLRGPSWRTGLSKIVSIPCRGSYTRIIGRHTLLVTDETREDPRRFSEALQQFR